MIKKIIVSFCLLISLNALAQEGTSSPYSYYGIGDIKFKGTAENRAMGGLSVFPDSIHINLQNPAQLASLKLINLNLGGTYLNTSSKSEQQTEKARRTAIDYLAVGIPVGKVGIGFGLIPYSSVGYKIEKLSNDTNPIYSRYNGIGGLSKVFLGLGFKLNKQFSFGADVQYNFGKIETTNLRYQDGFDFIELGTRENNTSDMHGVNFDLGLTYQTKLNKKLSFFSALTYSPQVNLLLDNSRSIETVRITSTITPQESIDVLVEDTKIKLPSKIAFGSGFGEVKKWLIGGEITYLNTSVTSNRFNDIYGPTDANDNRYTVSYKDAMRYTIGGYFIPNYNSYSSYLKKITYRAGLRYENTGLVLQGKSINDAAVNIGLGLPLGGSFSNINIGLEVGKRGTKYYNLVEENYVNLSIGLSFSDKWFVKRKYD
ncbi:outer membrane protein transport protein [Flavobacterium phycosphaerae]|uniref:outer membrane protein transport protein n=1 Tax=Flavobacterium phycosphaerae TaxID=2697515 RepID=UPI001389F274|nr:outer membrane protein transport protein [Flavobacterium phycosphaerae]